MKKTRRMSKASQIAFAKSWLEAQNIEAQTVDITALIDGSLSYEENIKNLKKHLNMGGRSRQKATRTMTASECDVSIGNYQHGMNGIEKRRACACGDPDACEDPKPKPKKPKAKPKPKPKKKAVKAKKPKPVKSKPKKVLKVGKKRTAKKKSIKSLKKKVCTVVRVKGYVRKCPKKKRK